MGQHIIVVKEYVQLYIHVMHTRESVTIMMSASLGLSVETKVVKMQIQICSLTVVNLAAVLTVLVERERDIVILTMSVFLV